METFYANNHQSQHKRQVVTDEQGKRIKYPNISDLGMFTNIARAPLPLQAPALAAFTGNNPDPQPLL